MIKTRLIEIIETLSTGIDDAEKSDAANAAACRRLRKICMSVTKEIKELRALALEQSKR